MIDQIRTALEKVGVSLWRITENHEYTAELYYIRKRLDMPRIKDCTGYSVEVFRDFEADGKKFRGSSRALISSGMEAAETEKRISSAWLAASFVRNPWFELAEPVQAEKCLSSSPLAADTPEKNAVRFAEILFSADTAEDAFLNSVEIFAIHSDVHIIGSNGLDVSYADDRIEGELVAQCVTPTDVEQYRGFGYDRLDEKQIRDKVTDAIEDVRARAAASEPPKSGKYDLLLKGEQICTLMEYYATRSHAAYVSAGYSDWKPGDVVQGKEITGENLSLCLASRIPYSNEGIPLTRRELITKGELKLVHGPTRFCRYAGVEPTGDYNAIQCENGSLALSEMKKEGVLEPISFSDFQMDAMDGHFKGEMRLALLHHADGSVEKLTGGSVNGSLPELQGNLLFSVERYTDLNYEGPLAVLIPGVAVAGK